MRLLRLESITGRMASLAGVAIFFVMLFIAGSCGRLDKVEYSDYRDFGPQGWDPARYLEFTPWPADSSRAAYAHYDLLLYVRYSDKCGLQSLPVVVETVSLSGIGSERPDTLMVSVPLYSSTGERKGKGSYTVFEVLDTLRKDISVVPGYRVTISNPLDAPSTRGLVNIGLILSRSESDLRVHAKN